MKKPPFNPDLVNFAKANRKEMTREERKLWYDFLRNYPLKIYKQRPMGNYIADFYCEKAQLIIEVDGIQHQEEQHATADEQRTAYFQEHKITVIRIPNKLINTNFVDVCEYLHKIIQERYGKKININ